MGSPRIRPMIINHFLANPGIPQSITQVCDATDLGYQQVQSAVYNVIRNENLPGLRCLAQGSLWQYDPEALPDPDQGSTQGAMASDGEPTWYYEIGRSLEGHPIVRTEDDGTLYVLKHLEV